MGSQEIRSVFVPAEFATLLQSRTHSDWYGPASVTSLNPLAVSHKHLSAPSLPAYPSKVGQSLVQTLFTKENPELHSQFPAVSFT